jgi:hypothetical protein
MNVRTGRLFVPLAVIVVALGACGPGTPAMPRLEDPREIVAEAIRTTAELEYVHARLELEAQAADPAGGVGNTSMGYAVDLDLDLVRREFHALLEGNLGPGGSMRAELLVVGNEMFSRTEGDASLGASVGWHRTPMVPGGDPRAGLPSNDVIAAVLDGFLDDPGLELRLAGMEDCASGTCYHVTATVAPDLTWRVVNGQLFGGPAGGVDRPVDPNIPVVAFDLLVDEGTRRLISLSTSVAVIGTATSVRMTLSDHDREVRFVPPPPDQVQDVEQFAPGGGMDGGGVILEDVGNEAPGPS